MSTVCQICGKGTSSGSRIVRHGLAKKKGGIGLHTTAVTKRLFKANLQKLRARVGGTVKTMTVCTSCIKAGKVVKAGKATRRREVARSFTPQTEPSGSRINTPPRSRDEVFCFSDEDEETERNP